MSKKTHFIGLRVSEEEYSSLIEFAEYLGKDVPFSNVGISSAVRYCISTQLFNFQSMKEGSYVGDVGTRESR